MLGACIGAFLLANDLIDNIDNEISSGNNGDYVSDNIENKFIEIFNLEDNGNFIAEFKDFLKKLLGRE
jgi:uncharacterized UPF0160 family protein